MPTFYRIVHGDPPPLEDMLSLEAKGATPRRLNPQKERMAKGISVFATRETAEDMARTLRGKHGWFLAELDIPERTELTYELTGDNGHYTLWGDPVTILATVVRVTPIAREPTAPEGD